MTDFDDRIPTLADDGCDDWNSALGIIHDVKRTITRLEDHPNHEVANQAFGTWDALNAAEGALEDLENDLFRRKRILSLLRRAKKADASIEDVIQVFKNKDSLTKGENQ